jgi:hypothetical protein
MNWLTGKKIEMREPYMGTKIRWHNHEHPLRRDLSDRLWSSLLDSPPWGWPWTRQDFR